jgi:hypothetical protein
VLEYFFILSRQNQTWTGTGYVVDTDFDQLHQPALPFFRQHQCPGGQSRGALHQFYQQVAYANFSGMSHVMDGVVHLTVRPYDTNGVLDDEQYNFAQGSTNVQRALPDARAGEVGFYMFSNTLPASVEIQLGALEDRTLQRAESLAIPAARSNYLARAIRQAPCFPPARLDPNVDPAAYQ